MKYLSKGSVRVILLMTLVTVCLWGCSSTKSAEKTTGSAPLTTTQPKKEEPPGKPPSKISPQAEKISPAKPSPPPPAPPPKVEAEPPLRMAKVVWSAVNLREGPGMKYKVIGNVKKGASLAILEVKGDWLHVRLEDRTEAWVSKSATSEAPKPAPPPRSSSPSTTTTPTAIKPAPM